ncbi:unnamed protein product [Symbiodinium sp. CCMP2456]|nr:unnamed protein product [Symbiodinium sp. CCMP2456]
MEGALLSQIRMKDLELNVLKETLIVEQRRVQQLKERVAQLQGDSSGTSRRDGRMPEDVGGFRERAPEAAALIGHIDARSQDIEERRRVFKNLILQWHPDKNEDPRATTVFRYLMAKRDAFLATGLM